MEFPIFYLCFIIVTLSWSVECNDNERIKELKKELTQKAENKDWQGVINVAITLAQETQLPPISLLNEISELNLFNGAQGLEKLDPIYNNFREEYEDFDQFFGSWISWARREAKHNAFISEHEELWYKEAEKFFKQQISTMINDKDADPGHFIEDILYGRGYCNFFSHPEISHTGDWVLSDQKWLDPALNNLRRFSLFITRFKSADPIFGERERYSAYFKIDKICDRFQIRSLPIEKHDAVLNAFVKPELFWTPSEELQESTQLDVCSGFLNPTTDAEKALFKPGYKITQSLFFEICEARYTVEANSIFNIDSIDNQIFIKFANEIYAFATTNINLDHDMQNYLQQLNPETNKEFGNFFHNFLGNDVEPHFRMLFLEGKGYICESIDKEPLSRIPLFLAKLKELNDFKFRIINPEETSGYLDKLALIYATCKNLATYNEEKFNLDAFYTDTNYSDNDDDDNRYDSDNKNNEFGYAGSEDD